MPRALEPNQRFPYVLQFDRDKPEGEQPTFWFRSLSMREWKTLARLYDALDQDNVVKRLDDVIAAIRIGLVGWNNLIDPDTGEQIPYAPDELERLIDPFEANELFEALVGQNRATADDKKNSA